MSLPSGKAPGPDGFTTSFFKSCWDLIGPDVTAALNQLFNLRGKRWNLLNSAQITLIHKSDDAVRVKDFRPISLMHSVAKILCKTLSLRLAPFLSTLVPYSQSAFIQTRCIQDNFLYVKNAIRMLYKNKEPSLFLKLDIAGAFDLVSWGYLLELMQRLGFGAKWCDMISLIWGSASSRVMANGELGNRFYHRQGLRQGDPLSPMLFTIAIAPLHWLFLKATTVGALTPLHLPPSQLRVSLYADDAALFLSPTSRDIEVCKGIFCAFGSASGLCANLTKSGVYPVCCEELDLQALLQAFPIAVMQFPCKYLGLPLHYRKISRNDVQPTLDKMASKLQRWRGKLLSSDARVRLVNSVLSAIPTYLISVFKLDIWAIKQIDKLRRNFLWRSKPEASGGIALLNWATVCRPKRLGGLGVLDIRKFGRALRLRWMWLDKQREIRPWTGSVIPCDEVDQALFRASSTLNFGNGRDTSFWHDRWLDGQAPKFMAPDLFVLSTKKKISVSEAINGQAWMAGLRRITQTSQLRQYTHLWLRLQQVQLNSEVDSVSWKGTTDGVYSARSAYQYQFMGSYSSINFEKLWKTKVEGKCRFFMWLWLRGRVLTNDNLQTRGIPHANCCPLCDQEETPFHLILKCSFSRDVWHQVACLCETMEIASNAQAAASISEWWNDLTCSLARKDMVTAIYTCCQIWKERNRRVFEHVSLTADGVLHLIRQDLRLPTTTMHWLSDCENDPPPEPD
uniref:Reverse transcriptase domain-containing protein n=3 Tax=Aegilops tauschii subsp. strangulata TaxID=200361 RepID=A0A453PG11_AEGTS